ncbi:hypothetical protein LINPERPRIM_LOCUS9365 [Linum perenne]
MRIILLTWDTLLILKFVILMYLIPNLSIGFVTI